MISQYFTRAHYSFFVCQGASGKLRESNCHLCPLEPSLSLCLVRSQTLVDDCGFLKETELMALSVIVVLYVSIGFLSAAGSVSISKKLFSAKVEQTFFGLFLIAIAGFYLAFTAYFGHKEAWRLETVGVIGFATLGVLGIRLPVVLIIGYLLHGVWDVLHEIHAHGGGDLFCAQRATELPLGYGAFCATYDWCMAAYFYTRCRKWSAAWVS
jgi:hypothetical protein